MARVVNKFKHLPAKLSLRFSPIGEFGFRKKQDFLVDNFLPQNGLVILAGDPKVGKTALASAIALAVAKGRPFAGMDTKQGGVLWLCLEESWSERSAIMKAERNIRTLPFFISYDHLPIDTKEGFEELLEWVVETKARLLVVDPLHAAHSGRSLADGWAARKTLKLLKQLSRHCTVLVIHHLAKRGAHRLADSVQIAAISTMVMLLSKSAPASGAPETGRAHHNRSTSSLLSPISAKNTPHRHPRMHGQRRLCQSKLVLRLQAPARLSNCTAA